MGTGLVGTGLVGSAVVGWDRPHVGCAAARHGLCANPAQRQQLSGCSVEALQRFSVAAFQCCSATFHVSALHVAALPFMLQRVFHIAALLHVAALRSMLQRGFHVSRCMLRYSRFVQRDARCHPWYRRVLQGDAR